MLTADQSEHIRVYLADLCETAKKAVTGGEHYKTTILLRAPHLPDGDVLVTEDSDVDIISAIQRRLPQ